MTEEMVTKSIMKWLHENGWTILTYDFPQSGTGKQFLPDDSEGNKNLNAIVPDIVTVRDGQCLFFENKNRYYYPDYKKINNLIHDNIYQNNINDFLNGYQIDKIYYGIGLPEINYKGKAVENKEMTNFIVTVSEELEVDVVYGRIKEKLR